ncbi:MAG TPA: HAMP domain-containing sensor histidine kinase, partial [Rhizomicrobium sp.]|nr:HAMP domain-containing sensor histidine kinase [Rhizomicrobium sp.]
MEGPFTSGNALRVLTHSLSSRLLLLTLLYVLVTEILIFVPAIGRYHESLLEDHVKSAELAVLPFTESSGKDVSPELRQQLLQRAGANAVALKRMDVRDFYLVSTLPTKIDRAYDIFHASLFSEMANALDCILNGGNRALRITSWTQIKGAEAIDVILFEDQIHAALVDYARNIALLALLISVATALLVFASLYIVLVRPMRKLTQSMIAFRENPEDPSRIVSASQRRDEIGIAERELGSMQRDLYASLQQKNRLAALGVAVAKIQHDLRNILSNAQLASDRLASVDDPVVQRLAPRLVASLDRAVSLATSTLRYGRAEEREPARAHVPLLPIVEEAVQAAIDSTKAENVASTVDIDAKLLIDADPEQLYRIVLNLARNAVEAMTSRSAPARLTISAQHQSMRVTIDIADNGPGIPEKVRERLFQPFAGTARPGGSGLGLAIARDLA